MIWKRLASIIVLITFYEGYKAVCTQLCKTVEQGFIFGWFSGIVISTLLVLLLTDKQKEDKQ